MGGDTNITDLSRLHRCLVERKLKFRIGQEKTPADGNCFHFSVIQAKSNLTSDTEIYILNNSNIIPC